MAHYITKQFTQISNPFCNNGNNNDVLAGMYMHAGPNRGPIQDFQVLFIIHFIINFRLQ